MKGGNQEDFREHLQEDRNQTRRSKQQTRMNWNRLRNLPGM
jgi:hypothetical protein